MKKTELSPLKVYPVTSRQISVEMILCKVCYIHVPVLEFQIMSCCCCCIVVLRPQETSKVMSGWSVNLTTLFLGRLKPPKQLTSTSCTYTYFCQ